VDDLNIENAMIEKPFTEILRLPISALQECVQQELLENPVLELEEEPGNDRAAEEIEPSLNETYPESGAPIAPLRLYRPDSDAVLDKGEVIESQPHFSRTDGSDPEPDIAIERTGKGCYETRPLDGWVARLFVSLRYLELYRQSDTDPKARGAREYLERKIRSAKSLIKAIKERRILLEIVTGAIIEQERSLLDTDLQPSESLDMQRLADHAGLSLAKVRKVIDNKWVQTPHGTFRLRRFFRPSP
jgi:DNA-directed RNA polymerase specialized sigma54-like protein